MPLTKYEPKNRSKRSANKAPKPVKNSLPAKKEHTTIKMQRVKPEKRSYSKNEPEYSFRRVKIYRLILIFFYGQFFATAIYTHLIHEIPVIIKHPDRFYPNLKVGLGIFMVIHTVFAVVSIWKKSFKLIFGSICSLIVLSIITMVTAIIDLVRKNDRQQLHETEMASTGVEIAVEALLRLLAVGLSLLLVRELRSKYDAVNAGDEEEDDDDIELDVIKTDRKREDDDVFIEENEIENAYNEAEKQVE